MGKVLPHLFQNFGFCLCQGQDEANVLAHHLKMGVIYPCHRSPYSRPTCLSAAGRPWDIR